MTLLAPGTILQHMYFKERLGRVEGGRFVEIGVGKGALSRLLLDMGWTGTGFELNTQAMDAAARVNREYVESGRYALENENWLEVPSTAPVDLVVSSMVLEHMNEGDEKRYLSKCREELSDRGIAVLFVPSGRRYWGIEDELAGHLRRYSFEDMTSKCEAVGLTIRHMAGLTCPLSNILLPISNVLVGRGESEKSDLSLDERTRASGDRDVMLKTTFPRFCALVLNEVVLYPFHIAQKLCRRSARSMVLYVEGSRSVTSTAPADPG